MAVSYTIFIVEDEPVERRMMQHTLDKDYLVKDFGDAESALQVMKSLSPDLVLLDIGLPGMSGMEMLALIMRDYPDTLVVMTTSHDDVKTIVGAMKLGAYDYIVKPVQMDALKLSVQHILGSIAMKKEIRVLHEEYLKENLPCFIGESNVIQDVMELVKKIGASPDTSVLIGGETGTGKELIARAIHYRSPNCKGPLISLNCASIPKDLLESELFGYEKGAFSGANKNGKAGLVEKAANGTLFLDEVGDLSLEAQAKLLRFLENGEYYRVGGTTKRSVQTRVVSATNRDLPAMIDDDLFRRDLYFRFAVVKIDIPSLNDRHDDILPIAKYFLVQLAEKGGKKIIGFTPEAQVALKMHHWVGNVRELKNVVERGVLLCDDRELGVKDLGLDGSPVSEDDSEPSSAAPILTEQGLDLPDHILAIEKSFFAQALELADGNESNAAKLLNVSRDSFRYRRKKLEI